MKRRRISVLAHKAQFLTGGPPGDHIFVKITNTGRRRVGVSHVWVDGPSGQIPFLVVPLPAYLEPEQQIEVWINIAALPVRLRTGGKVLRLIRVKLTAGRVFKSKPNTTVPSSGFVASVESQQ